MEYKECPSDAKIQIYTDGACEGNPGKGSYACVLIYGNHRKELYGNYRHTTNNRMELIAVIKALEALKKPSIVDLYSDSQYIVYTINKNWSTNKNKDLWDQVYTLLKKHSVAFHWVKGHSNNIENNRCDYLANLSLKKEECEIDSIYEKSLSL